MIDYLKKYLKYKKKYLKLKGGMDSEEEEEEEEEWTLNDWENEEFYFDEKEQVGDLVGFFISKVFDYDKDIDGTVQQIVQKHHPTPYDEDRPRRFYVSLKGGTPIKLICAHILALDKSDKQDFEINQTINKEEFKNWYSRKLAHMSAWDLQTKGINYRSYLNIPDDDDFQHIHKFDIKSKLIELIKTISDTDLSVAAKFTIEELKAFLKDPQFESDDAVINIILARIKMGNPKIYNHLIGKFGEVLDIGWSVFDTDFLRKLAYSDIDDLDKMIYELIYIVAKDRDVRDPKRPIRIDRLIILYYFEKYYSNFGFNPHQKFSIKNFLKIISEIDYNQPFENIALKEMEVLSVVWLEETAFLQSEEDRMLAENGRALEEAALGARVQTAHRKIEALSNIAALRKEATRLEEAALRKEKQMLTETGRAHEIAALHEIAARRKIAARSEEAALYELEKAALGEIAALREEADRRKEAARLEESYMEGEEEERSEEDSEEESDDEDEEKNRNEVSNGEEGSMEGSEEENDSMKGSEEQNDSMEGSEEQNDSMEGSEKEAGLHVVMTEGVEKPPKRAKFEAGAHVEKAVEADLSADNEGRGVEETHWYRKIVEEFPESPWYKKIVQKFSQFQVDKAIQNFKSPEMILRTLKQRRPPEYYTPESVDDAKRRTQRASLQNNITILLPLISELEIDLILHILDLNKDGVRKPINEIELSPPSLNDSPLFATELNEYKTNIITHVEKLYGGYKNLKLKDLTPPYKIFAEIFNVLEEGQVEKLISQYKSDNQFLQAIALLSIQKKIIKQFTELNASMSPAFEEHRFDKHPFQKWAYMLYDLVYGSDGIDRKIHSIYNDQSNWANLTPEIMVQVCNKTNIANVKQKKKLSAVNIIVKAMREILNMEIIDTWLNNIEQYFADVGVVLPDATFWTNIAGLKGEGEWMALTATKPVKGCRLQVSNLNVKPKK